MARIPASLTDRRFNHLPPNDTSLPLTLLLIAAESRTGAYKGWSASTAELRNALLRQRGLAGSRVDDYLELFGTWDKADHAAFHERIEGCMLFLREIGVHVRKWKPGGGHRSTEADGGRDSSGDEEDGTRWTIEVPAWKHKRGHTDCPLGPRRRTRDGEGSSAAASAADLLN